MLQFKQFAAFGIDLAPPLASDISVRSFDGHHIPFENQCFDVPHLGA
jgi:hypothetical protein